MSFHDMREQARRLRRVPLEAVLVRSGASRDPSDRKKWHTDMGTLSVTGMKFMNWNRGIGGGGAIDLVIHLNNCNFKGAVGWLEIHFPFERPPSQALSHEARPLCLPRPDTGNLPRVRRYLVSNRGLDPWRVDSVIDSGRLYADNKANAVFLLLGEDQRPVGAELRGTTTRPWRGMAPGSKKDLGYFSTLRRGVSMVLCESAIDAISCENLYPQHHCVSTSGARPTAPWLTSLIDQYHETFCGYDADTTGDFMASAMIAQHPTVKRFRPSRQDWNDVLIATRAALELL